MTAGHSSFDIDPTIKEPRACWRTPYQVMAGLVIVLVVGCALYAMARYERARVIAGPLVQAQGPTCGSSGKCSNHPRHSPIVRLA